MQQIYRKTPTSQCDFNKVALRLIASVNSTIFHQLKLGNLWVRGTDLPRHEKWRPSHFHLSHKKKKDKLQLLCIVHKSFLSKKVICAYIRSCSNSLDWIHIKVSYFFYYSYYTIKMQLSLQWIFKWC